MIRVSPEDFISIVVGVDPAITAGEDADETGIIIAASGPHQPDTCVIPHCDTHAYVLEDATLPKGGRITVDMWANQVVDKFDEWNAGMVVVEGNQGRDLLKEVLGNIRPTMPVDTAHAGENKKARAEPIVSLYAQGRAHHVGDPMGFVQLENQMTSWIPKAGKHNSPDRLDALVWALTALNINNVGRQRNWAEEGVMAHMSGQASWTI